MPILDEKLPTVIKTLYLFPQITGIIFNSGFEDLFASYRRWAVFPCIKGLYEIGEYDAAQILLYTYAAYDMLIDADREEVRQEAAEKFGPLSSVEQMAMIEEHILDNIDEFEKMLVSFRLKEYDPTDWYSLFIKAQEQTMQHIVDHIRANPNDYVTDEDGQPFDLNFTGVYSNPSNDTINYELSVKDGKPHGHFKIYEKNSNEINYEGEFENGFLKSYTWTYISQYDDSKTRYDYEFEHYKDTVLKVETKYYKNSDLPKKQSRQFKYSLSDKIGEQKEWYESGAIKKIETYEENGIRLEEQYYESGQLQSKRLCKSYPCEERSEYYENGQQSLEEFYDDKKQEHSKSWHKDGSIAGYTVYDDEGNYIEHQTFYPNGGKESEFIKDKGGERTYLNYWDEEGNQTLKDGTGFLEYDYGEEEKCLHFREEFKDKLAHGLHLQMYSNGQVWIETYYENGEEIYYKSFDKQGNLINEYKFNE